MSLSYILQLQMYYISSSRLAFSVLAVTQLLVRVDILLARGKQLHGCILPLPERLGPMKTGLTPPLILKYVFQAMKVRCHVYVYQCL